MDRPILDLTWDYPTEGPLDEPDSDAILAEINGYDADRKPLSSYTQLKSDGSTACGCWIYCGVRADGVNQADRRKPGREQNWVANEWGWAWPRTAGCSTTGPQPTRTASRGASARPWSGGTRRTAKWTGHDIPDFIAEPAAVLPAPPGATGVAAIAGDDPFIMQADGKAWLFTPAGLVDGPMPAHYEPQESPLPNLFYGQQHNPVRGDHLRPPGPLPAERRRARVRGLPVRDHHLPADRAPHGGRDVALPALPGRTPAGVLLRGARRSSLPSEVLSTWAGRRSSPPGTPSRRG